MPKAPVAAVLEAGPLSINQASVDDLRRVRFISAATVKRLRPFVSTD